MLLENTWLFPVIESIHVMGLAAFVGTIVLADLRTLGFQIPDTQQLKPWMHSGLAVMLVTGVAMFLSDTARYLHNPAFHVKVTLLVLALVAHFTLRRSETRFAAALSLALWTSVVLAARAIADFDV
ncbi:MAG: putative rane protein [Bryobacterales bacterium]|nr:putative rane protein [Bryobacterales bacterium]